MVSIMKKLFKRITIFDLLVGVILIGLLLFFFLYFVKDGEWTTVQIKVRAFPVATGGQRDNAPSYWLAQSINPSDAQYDGMGQKIAEIEQVSRWGDYLTETWIVAKLKTTKDRSGTLHFNYQDVFIGAPIRLQTGQSSLDGIVTNIHGQQDTRVKTDIKVAARVIDWTNKNNETLGVFPWVAAAIQKGDSMTTLNGETVATIDSVQSTFADRVTTTADGRLLLQKDPTRRDIFLTATLKTIKSDQTHFFLEDYPIKIDADVPLYFPEYKIFIRIIDIL